MQIIKKDGYYGIVIHQDEDKLFVATPRFTKVFKRAGQNAQAYEYYLEFKNQTQKKRGLVRVRMDEIECVESPDTREETIARVSALSSTVIKDAVDHKISKENPLVKYEMDEFFSDKKKISKLIAEKNASAKLVKRLTGFISVAQDIVGKINGLTEWLNTQATFMNAKAVEDISNKISSILAAFKKNEVLSNLNTLAEVMVDESEDEFDAEKYLGIID